MPCVWGIIDIIAEFDGNILEPIGVTLSKERENSFSQYVGEDYAIESNSDIPGEISVMIFANSEPVTGSGTIANLNFRVIGEPSDGTLIELTKLVCNETPLSGTRRFILRTKPEDLMQYDLDNDGKVSLQDAIYALRQRNLKAAITALQAVTGIK